jgi:hypothetical protein
VYTDFKQGDEPMTTHDFTQEAQAGNWKVFVSPSTNYGYFENQVTETSGGIWFKGRMVTEYDGVFELPANVVKALRTLRKSFDKFILPE